MRQVTGPRGGCRGGLRGFFGLILACVVSVGGAAAAAESCKAADRALADQALRLSVEEAAAAVREVFPWGAPRAGAGGDAADLLVQRDYVIGYDPDLLGPVWSADVLGVKPLKGGRIDCFRTDPRLSAATASTQADYSEPIFDQGHMVPNGDMTFSDVAIMNTFVMSNMSPQFCQFNRGVWQILETFVRSWSATRGPLYVINGAVFDRDGDGRRDRDSAAVRMLSRNGQARVAVPSMYYKILAHRREDGRLETLTVLLPHTQADVDGAAAVRYLDEHVSNVAAVEALTGLRFFPDDRRTRAEARGLWRVEGFRFKSLVNDVCRKTSGAWVRESSPPTYGLP